MPQSAEEFEEMRNQMATTPEGGAAMFVLAMNVYAQNHDLGLQCLLLMSEQTNFGQGTGSGSYKGYRLNTIRVQEWDGRLGGAKGHIAHTYILGTSHTNNYALPAMPWTVEIEIGKNKYAPVTDTQAKLFVRCTGADSMRPMTLKKNDKGIWKAHEYSSLQVGVKAPPPAADPL
jgi:hypothetical protein